MSYLVKKREENERRRAYEATQLNSGDGVAEKNKFLFWRNRMNTYTVKVWCDRQGVEVEEVVQWQRTCDYIRGESLKGCSLKATWAFKEAPHGTAHPQRATVHLCTRHFNAEMRGQNDWILIRTSEFYPITPEVQARTKGIAIAREVREVFALAEEQHSGQCGTKREPCMTEANSFEVKL